MSTHSHAVDEPLRVEEPFREAGKTGVAEGAHAQFEGGKKSADVRSQELDVAVSVVTPVLTGQPDVVTGTDGKTYEAKDVVPIAEASGNYGSVPPAAVQMSVYGVVEGFVPQNVYEDPGAVLNQAGRELEAARKRRKRIVIGLVGGGSLALVVGTILGALAGAGVFSKPVAPKSKDLDEDLPDPLKAVDFGDLPALNGAPASAAVTLLDGNDAATAGPLVNPEGTWTLLNNHITFELTKGFKIPASGGSFNADYRIVGGTNGNLWGIGTLRVNYPPTAAAIAPIMAKDRVGPVDVPVLAANPGFLGTIVLDAAMIMPSGAGTWQVDASNQVTFLPKVPLPGNVLSVQGPYVLERNGLPSKPQTVVINFPPPPPTPVGIAVPATASPVDIDTTARNASAGSTVRLWDGANAVLTLKDQVTGGNWEAHPTTGHITFTYATAITTSVPVKAQYVLLRNGGISAAAAVEIDFPIPAGLPTPVDITLMGAASPMDIDILGRNRGFSGTVSLWDGSQPVPSLTDVATGGTWVMGATAGHLAFSYTGPITARVQAKAQYVFIMNGVPSAAGSLAIDFPIPAGPGTAVAIMVPATASPVDIDVPGKNGSFSGKVKLWDGNGPVASITDAATGGTWSVDPASQHVLFNYVVAIVGTVPVKAQYVLESNGVPSLPGSLEVDFPIPVPPAKPADLSQTNASRDSFSLFNITLADPGDRISLVGASSSVDGVWSVQTGNVVEFTPQVPCKAPSVSIQYVVVRGAVLSPPGTLTVTFATVPEVYPCFAMENDRSVAMHALLSTSSVVPNGLASITLFADDTATALSSTTTLTTADANWTVDVANNRVDCLITNAAVSSSFIYYLVTDATGIHSLKSTITASIVPLMAKHFLLAQAIKGSAPIAANVLAEGISIRAKDSSSVVLSGVADLGRKHVPQTIYLSDDHKAMHVKGEGNWLVDDNGLIVFKADATATEPPSPAIYHFFDVNGNESTSGMVLIDPAVKDLAPFFDRIAGLSDADFWKGYHKLTVDDPPVALGFDALLSYAQTYALAVRRLAPWTGACPVTDADYQTAYAKWSAAGNGADDLISICTNMAGTSSVPYLSRYWGLNLMVRMLVDFIP